MICCTEGRLLNKRPCTSTLRYMQVSISASDTLGAYINHQQNRYFSASALVSSARQAVFDRQSLYDSEFGNLSKVYPVRLK